MTTVEDLGVPWTRSIGLAGHAYDVEISKIVRQTLPILRNSANQSTEPGEQSISYENIWPRAQHDWRLGTNQPYFDEDDANRHRFADSIGVNPWGQRSLTLHKKVNLLEANTDFLYPVELSVVYDGSLNVWLYWMTGGVIKLDNDPDTGMDGEISETGKHIIDFTDDGTSIYMALDSGPVRVIGVGTGTTTSPAFGTFTADHVQVANGRLIATDGPRVVELDSSGGFGAAGQLDYTHPHAAFQWDFITPAPNGTYLTGHLGSSDQTSTYFITVNPNTGGLTSPTLAVAWPAGEYMGCMAFYGGVMICGISKVFGLGGGFRLANINADGTLTYGPLAPTPPSFEFTGQNGVTALCAQGEYCWFTWGTPRSGYHGVGRMWLARFTEPLVPAYATDLMVGPDGSAAGQVPAVAVRLGKVYFVLGSHGLYGESDTDYIESGELDVGNITFSTTEKKSPVAIDWRNAPMPAGASITAAMAVDQGSYATIATYATEGGSGQDTPVAISGSNKGEDFQLKFTLNRGDNADETPELKRWTFRAMPTPPRVDEILLPIILHGQVDPEGDLDNPYNTLAEYRFLKNLEADGAIVDLVIGSTTEKVKIDQIQYASERVIGGTSFVITWNDDHTFFNAPLTLRLLTVVPISELA